jgi:tRNA A-37 threonylcarbamoyl transferase component Bud32
MVGWHLLGINGQAAMTNTPSAETPGPGGAVPPVPGHGCPADPPPATPLPARAVDDGVKTTPPAKSRTGRIPKPMPRGQDGTTMMPVPADDPMSTETISLKRPDMTPKVSSAGAAPEAAKARPLKIFCWKCGQKLDLSDMEPFSQIGCPSCQSAIIVPKWFDNYLLEEKAGEGGMAFVYRGLDLALDREVAIKVLSPDLAKEEQKGNLFLHEARTAATLNHYAVLPIYTCGEFEDQPYIVMQWMAGGSLDVKLEAGKEPLPVPDVVKWIRDIAEGLDNARRHGIIHHDVKPANIMMDADGNVKIGDFGISQALHDARSAKLNELTKAWASPHYVSPEKVATGKETYLGDIYSLGATFHHLLTGREPFADEHELDRLIRIRLDKDPPEPRTLRAEVPEAVSALVMAMMARTPEARPGYRDIINDLNAALKGGGRVAARKAARIPAKGNGAPLSATRLKINASEFGRGMARANAPARGGGGFLVVLLLAAALVGGGAYYLMQHAVPGGTAAALASDDYLPAVTRAFALGDSRQAQALAEKTLDDPLASVAERRQAALQAALAVYLNRADGAPSQCRLIAGRLEAADAAQGPASTVLGFLAGRANSPDGLRPALAGHPDMLAALEMAGLLRILYERAPRDQIQTAYRSYHQAATQLPGGHWATIWRGRAEMWIDWIVSGQGSAAALEPLIAAIRPPEVGELPPAATPAGQAAEVVHRPPVQPERLAAELRALSAEWLKERRSYAGARPRPNDYTFGATAFRTYLGQIPADAQEGERKRFQQVSSLKSYLCKMMMRFSYDGGSVRLRNGQRLSGSIMANENYLSIRTSSGRRRIQWGEVPVDQMAAFLEHYAKVRLQASAGTVSDGERNLEGARDYLRVALLHDWYGNYADAVAMARQAMATDARVGGEIQSLLME